MANAAAHHPAKWFMFMKLTKKKKKLLQKTNQFHNILEEIIIQQTRKSQS